MTPAVSKSPTYAQWGHLAICLPLGNDNNKVIIQLSHQSLGFFYRFLFQFFLLLHVLMLCTTLTTLLYIRIWFQILHYIFYKDFLLLVKNLQSRFIADMFKRYLQSIKLSESIPRSCPMKYMSETKWKYDKIKSLHLKIA